MLEAEADAQRVEHRKLAWHTWHVAALHRASKIPNLDKFLSTGTGKAKPRQTALEQMKIMEAWAARLSPRKG